MGSQKYQIQQVIELEAKLGKLHDAKRINEKELASLKEITHQIQSNLKSDEYNRQIVRVLSAIRNVNQLITKVNDPKKLIEQACKELTQTSGYYSAWIILFNKDLSIHSSVESNIGKSCFNSFLDDYKAGNIPLCIDKAFKHNKLVMVEHPLDACNNCPQSDMYKNQSAFTIQLKHNNKFFGIISISLPNEYVHDKEEQDLFKEVAGDISFALYSIDQKEKREAAEKEKADLLHNIGERYKELNLLYEVAKLKTVNKDLKYILKKTCELIPPAWHYSDITCARIKFNNKSYKTKNFKQTQWLLSKDIILDNKKIGSVEIGYLKEMPQLDEGPFLAEERNLLSTLANLLGNIIKNKTDQKALKDSEERFRRAIEDAPNPIMIHAEDGEVLKINAIWTEITGYTLNDIPTIKEWTKKAYGKQMDSVKKIIDQLYKLNRRNNEGEFTVRTKQGAQRIWSFSTAPLGLLPDGRRSVLSMAVDITERKKIKNALAKQEEEYRLLFNRSTVGIFKTTSDGKVLSVSPKMAQIVGCSSPREAIGHFNDLGHQLYADEQHRKTFIDHLKKHGEIENFEYEAVKMDGQHVWLNMSARVSEYKDDGTFLIEGFTMDVTDRKRAMDELAGERDYVEQIMETSPVSIVRLDNKGQINYANKRAIESLDIEMDEFTSRTYHDPKWKITTIDGEPFATENLPFNLVKSSGKPVYNVQHAVTTQKGKKIILSINAAPLFNKKGNFEGMVAAMEDITEQIKAQDQIRKSEERFRKLFENMKSGVAIFEPINNGSDFVFKDLNKAGLTIDNVKRNEIIGKAVTEVFPGVKDFGLFQVFKQVYKTGKPVSFEDKLYKDQRISGFRDNFVYKLPTGEIVSIYTDITERKTAEIERKKHLTETRLLNDALVAGSRIEDIDELCKYIGNKVYEVNNKCYVSVTLYDPDIDAIRIRSVVGLEKSMSRLMNILGINPLKMTFHQDTMKQTASLYVSGKLEKVQGGLYALAEGKISKSVCNAAEKAFNIGSVYTIGFALGKKPYGGILIFVPKNQQIQHKEAIEHIANHLAVVIHKKQADAALADSEKRFKTLADLMPDIIFEMDRNMNISYTNQVAYEKFGYSYNEWEKGLSGLDLLIEGDRDKAKDNFVKRLKGEITSGVEYSALRKDGTVFPVYINASVIKRQDRPVGIRGVMIDISKLKEAEEQLIQQNEEYEALNEEFQTQNEELKSSFQQIQEINKELSIAKAKAEESDRLKSAFLCNISHEIRTPMNGILGFAELLKKPQLSGEKQAKFIQTIEDSGKRMLNIINELIDISRIEAGQITINPEEIDVNEQMQQLYNFFKPQSTQKGLSLNLNKQLSDGMLMLYTDKSKFNQILTNLISNAIKYTEEGKVEFGYAIEDKYIQFYVRDTGIGISQDYKNKIFDRFVQVNSEHSQLQEGAGLGLAITKAYIEKLGGEIWLESETNKGTTFYFTVSYDSGNPDELTIEQERGAQYDFNNFDNVKILVAEDDEISREYINEILAVDQFEIVFAKNGKEAIEMVNESFDVVLMDLKMPDIDGYEATRKIKQQYPQLPIIAQTAFVTEDDIEKAFAAGCDGYITKPIFLDKLYEIIDKHLKNE